MASRRIRSDFLPRRQDGEAAGQRSRWTFFSSLPDEKTIFAVIRAIEVVGQAIKNVPVDVWLRFPEIPWRDMAGMRDVMIHDYFGVDIETVWETIKANIPKTKPMSVGVLKRIEDETASR